MTAAVALPTPVEAHEVTEPLVLFRCTVLHAVLTGKACADRQRSARAKGDRFDQCFDCAIGRGISARLQAAPRVARCARAGCTADAAVDGYCKRHLHPARARGHAPRRSQPLPEHLQRLQPREESVMKLCEKPGCNRDADPDRGDGTLCMPHWRGTRVGAKQRGQKRGKQRQARKASAQRPPSAPRKPKEDFVVRIDAEELITKLKAANEALALVNVIGWDNARQLAARIEDGAR